MIFVPILALAILLLARFWLINPLAAKMGGTAILPVEHVLNVVLIVVAALLFDGLIRFFYWHRYWRRRRGRETPALIRDLLTIAIVLCALSVALWWQEGFSFAGLITASGATAILLGIALQTVIQDLFSGLSINLEGSYAIGDWLTVYSEHAEPTYGRVTGITWRATFLTLEDGRQLMIPNHTATSNPVLNHSRPRNGKRYSVEISVDSRLPCERVMELLLGEAIKVSRMPSMSALPTPDVVIDNVKGDTLFYHVRFYANPDAILPSEAKSLMYKALLDVVQQHALPMPLTRVEMVEHPHFSDVMDRDEVHEGLRHAALFSDVLDEQQLQLLARRCEIHQFPQGAVLMRQGEPASSMFIILEGAAGITIDSTSGDPREIAVLAARDIVGEMSLMTGAPRSATVTALTRLRTLEVTKEPIEELLRASPELLQRFSQVLAERLDHLNEHTRRAMAKAQDATDLLSKMKTFFSRVLR
jgi:small-conductance mechanosensitive channel/CRP-like cAMP-binding protein